MRDSSKRFEINRSKLKRTVSKMKRDYFKMRPSEKKKKKKRNYYELEYLTDRQKNKIREEALLHESRRKRILVFSFIITLVLVIVIGVFLNNLISQKQSEREHNVKEQLSQKIQIQQGKLDEFYKEKFALGLDYFYSGLLSNSQYQFERLRQEFPNDTTVLRMLARVYSEQCEKKNKKCTALLLTLNSWIQANPKSKDARTLKAEFLLGHKDLEHLKNKRWKSK